MKPRYKLLDLWVAQAIIDNPQVIKSGEATPEEIYAALTEIFSIDMQHSLKGIAKMVVNLNQKERAK